MIPRRIAKANPLIDPPPKMNRGRSITIVVSEVINVRLKVLLIARLRTSSVDFDVYIPRYSLIRSNTTTVSLIEYAITVSNAAIKAWFISSENGSTPQLSEKIPRIIIESWNKAATAPKLYCHLLNLIKMYKNRIRSAKIPA